MLPNQNQRTDRAEFKSLCQGEQEGIRMFSRQVRSVGDEANSNLNQQARDNVSGTFH